KRFARDDEVSRLIPFSVWRARVSVLLEFPKRCERLPHFGGIDTGAIGLLAVETVIDRIASFASNNCLKQIGNLEFISALCDRDVTSGLDLVKNSPEIVQRFPRLWVDTDSVCNVLIIVDHPVDVNTDRSFHDFAINGNVLQYRGRKVLKHVVVLI